MKPDGSPTIYFIRHGETDWNAEKRLQGQTDTHLNAKGRAQALRHAEALRASEPAIAEFDLVASPLARARETMEIVRAALGLQQTRFSIEPALAEIHLGDWQGYTWSENRARCAASVEARDRDPWATRAPGADGESYADLSARALPYLLALQRDTVIVSHGGVQRCLRRHVNRLPAQEIACLDAPQDRMLVWRSGTIGWL